MKKQKKVFRSRISVLLAGLLLAVFIPVFVPIVIHEKYEGLYGSVGALLFCLFLLSGMRYIISENKLYLKNWFIPCGSTNIVNITSVKRSYNPLSSPAASLKRLHIRITKHQPWLISPVREQEFIKDLKAINPDIEVSISDKKGMWRIWDWDI